MSPSRGLPKILPWLLFAAIAPTHLFWKGSLSSQAFCPLNSLAIGRRRTKPPDVYVVPLSRGGLPLFQQQQTPKERRDDTNQWQPGNMERDFDRLEQAIAFTNADQNLQHQERIETLNYIAQQRRPISPDLAMYVLSPLMASFALAIIFNHIDDSHGLGRQFLVKGAQYVSILHFWSMVILVPVFFLLVKQGMDRRRVGDSEADDGNLKLPSELQGLDSEYLRFVTLGSQQLDGNLPPSTTSTRDHVQCLLEQWTSAILGVAIFAPCWCKSSHGSLLWLVQCTTRLGVLASLRQYHGLWFALIRRKQPRPLPFQVVAMQSLTRLQFAPWFTALDLALLCVMPWPRLPWSTVCQFYGSAIVCTGLATMATRKPNRLAKYKENVVTRQIQKLRPPPIDLMVRAAGIGWLWKHRLSTLEYCQLSLDGLSKISFLEFCVYFPWFRFVKCMGISMALLGPLCHILAFRRLLRVRYTHGVSMAADMARFDQVENEDELISNTNSTCARSNKNGGWPPEQKGWRYWLTWREPKRIRVTLDQVFGGFWHWFLFSGSVEDKLRKEYRGKFQSEIKRRGLTVLQRVAEDQANLRSPAIADRSLWKQNAMIKIAEDHQNSYDLKSFDVSAKKCWSLSVSSNSPSSYPFLY